MKDNKEVGIITEQGYVAGQGLGYTPTDLNNPRNNENTKPNEEKQS